MANIADDTMRRLRRITNSLTKEDALNAVNDFKGTILKDHFKGKLRKWFSDTAAL